jgi:hypothetical protein
VSAALLSIGLLLIVAGAVIFVRPLPDPPPTGAVAERSGPDIAKILEELNKLLEKFDTRYRPGLVLMIIGLALVAMSVFVETRSTAGPGQVAANSPVAYEGAGVVAG